MADISQVKLPNGDTYNLVDETSGYIKNFTETDPVFSASAAAGITSTNISNWNGKSDTDEKVKTDLIPSTSTAYYLTLSSSNSSQTSTLLKASELSVYYTSDSTMKLILGQSRIAGMIRLCAGNSYYVDLGAIGSLSANRSIYFPNKSGTVALTSDIPQVYSSTNTSGYLTMATLPVYDGTVE